MAGELIATNAFVRHDPTIDCNESFRQAWPDLACCVTWPQHMSPAGCHMFGRVLARWLEDGENSNKSGGAEKQMWANCLFASLANRHTKTTRGEPKKLRHNVNRSGGTHFMFTL